MTLQQPESSQRKKRRKLAAKSYCRGWEIVRREGRWVYADTGKACWGPNDRRPCKKCGKEPTAEGHDACLGILPGVASACCGHGVYKGWVTTEAELGVSKAEIEKEE